MCPLAREKLSSPSLSPLSSSPLPRFENGNEFSYHRSCSLNIEIVLLLQRVSHLPLLHLSLFFFPLLFFSSSLPFRNKCRKCHEENVFSYSRMCSLTLERVCPDIHVEIATKQSLQSTEGKVDRAPRHSGKLKTITIKIKIKMKVNTKTTIKVSIEIQIEQK